MFQNSLLTPRPAWTVDALRALARHCFLSVRQLGALLAVPAEHLVEALAALSAEGLLQRLAVAADATRTAFALARPGIAFLRRLGEQLPARTRVPRRAPFTLAHELVVNDLAVVLDRLAATGAIQLLDWQTARERLADVTHLAVKGRVVRVPLVADALAVIATARGSTGLLVEVDMGTVSSARMRLKYEGYFSWWKEGGPIRRFGLASTRVLTIASTRRRMEQLRALATAAAPPGGTGLFWFLSADAVDPEAPARLLDPVAYVARAGDDVPRALLAASPTT